MEASRLTDAYRFGFIAYWTVRFYDVVSRRPERKPYTRYSREFKLEAVRQAALGEKPKAQIARALGIRVGHLRDWRLQFEEEARTGVTHPPPAVGQDLEQLRRENAKLKVENEILKKAAIYFAGESK